MASRIIRSFSMDFTMQVEHAQRADGTWFRRCQYRDARYGYKWSAWQQVVNGPSGHASETGRTARLPRVA